MTHGLGCAFSGLRLDSYLQNYNFLIILNLYYLLKDKSEDPVQDLINLITVS